MYIYSAGLKCNDELTRSLSKRRLFHLITQVFKVAIVDLNHLSPPYLCPRFQLAKEFTGRSNRNDNALYVYQFHLLELSLETTAFITEEQLYGDL